MVAAWYTYSADAGGRGNAVLAGHRDFGGQRGIFLALGRLAEGDEAWLLDGLGAWHLYRVTWSVSIPEDGAPVAELLGPTDVPSLTLITCAGTFSRSAGQYVERRLVRAELVDPAPR
jgi:sortase A